MAADPYYGPALAQVHHEGFGFHADASAPAILTVLEPVLERGGLVLELGCGSGLLTRHLTDAGHRVLATDASPAMLDLARSHAPDAVDHRRLVLPDDEVPGADAIVSVGHVVSYLRSRPELESALVKCARALRPDGVLVLDLEDLSAREPFLAQGPRARTGEDWALVTESVSDGPDHLARVMTIFVREADGRYRRETERHDNVLIDVEAVVPPLLETEGLEVTIGDRFGTEPMMAGLRTVIGRKRP